MAPPANQRRRWEIWMDISRQVYLKPRQATWGQPPSAVRQSEALQSVAPGKNASRAVLDWAGEGTRPYVGRGKHVGPDALVRAVERSSPGFQQSSSKLYAR